MLLALPAFLPRAPANAAQNARSRTAPALSVTGSTTERSTLALFGDTWPKVSDSATAAALRVQRMMPSGVAVAAPWPVETEDVLTDDDHEDTLALIVATTLALVRNRHASNHKSVRPLTAPHHALQELVGPVALFVVVALAAAPALAGFGAAEIDLATVSLKHFWATAPVTQLVGASWIGAEAAFYLACLAVALQATASTGHSPGTRKSGDVWGARGHGHTEWSAERRAEVWRRLLADPSQSTEEFVSGWMYRSDVATPSAASLLGGWAAKRAGLTRGTTAAEEKAARAASSVSYGELSVGDVYEWLSGAFFSKTRTALTAPQAAELRARVAELEAAASSPLQRRQGDGHGHVDNLASFSTTANVRSQCAGRDGVRWRHRPLGYYAVSHGVGATAYTHGVMAGAGFERRREGELDYWYRPPVRSAKAKGSGSGSASGAGGSGATKEKEADALVFVHGIGLGPAPYCDFVLSCVDDATPVVVLEMGGFAQRVFPRLPPSPERFAQLLDGALERLGVRRAVLVGHSLGSVYVNYAARRDRDTANGRGGGGRGRGRVGGVVLIDPVACLLHHATTTSAFVYNELHSLEDATMDYLFKKELWSAIVVSRHLPWHEASFFVDDAAASVPTLVTVGAADEVVAPRKVKAAFGSIKARLKGVRVLSMEGGHGSWLDSPELNAQLVGAVRGLRREVAGKPLRTRRR